MNCFSSRKNLFSISKVSLSAILFLFFLGGCAQISSFLDYSGPEAELFAEAEKRREEFLSERTAEPIQWLLSHRVQNGMSKGDVDRVLGTQGDRVFNDTKILADEGLYRADDIVYSWGPDKDGTSYMLVFRDNHLINYNRFEDQDKFSEMDRFF